MPKYNYKPYKPLPKFLLPAMAIIVVAVVAIAAIAYFGILSGHAQSGKSTIPTGTTSPTTTISGPTMVELSACGQIKKQGVYYLTKSVKYTSLSGSCINITSSNVELNCNGNKISGSGPYTGVSPYSYGVMAYGAKNVSLVDCNIMNFSYGAYLFSVSGGKLYLNNISLNTVSNLAL